MYRPAVHLTDNHTSMKRTYDPLTGSFSDVLGTSVLYTQSKRIKLDLNEEPTLETLPVFLEVQYSDSTQVVDITDRLDPLFTPTKLTLEPNDLTIARNRNYPNYRQITFGGCPDGIKRRVTFYDRKILPATFFPTLSSLVYPDDEGSLYNMLYTELDEEGACS